MLYKKREDQTSSEEQIKKLSICVKTEGILNLAAALILLYCAVHILLSTYRILTKLNYSDNHKVNIAIIIVISIAIIIDLIIHIIVSIKNFKSFIENVFSNLTDVIPKYKEYTKSKIIKRIILIIIGTILLNRYMAINILPFIFTLINKNYILNNAKTFNSVKKKHLKNQEAKNF